MLMAQARHTLYHRCVLMLAAYAYTVVWLIIHVLKPAGGPRVSCIIRSRALQQVLILYGSYQSSKLVDRATTGLTDASKYTARYKPVFATDALR